MRRSSVIFSAVAHVMFFIITAISLPWMRKDFVIPQPITVELAEVSQITQTNKVAPKPTPKPEKEDKKEDKPPPPPPAAKNTADEAVVPVKKDKDEDKPDDKKKEEVVEDKDAIPEKKKKPVKKPEKKKVVKEVKQKDFASVLKNLATTKEKPTPPDKQPDLKLNEQAQSTEGQDAPLGEKLTMSEEDALRHQLEHCWNVPFGAKDAEDLVVEIYMVINPDRTLREARVVDMARYHSDSFFRAAADSAMRAVRSPECSPFQVPPDKYDTWKTTTVTFNPSQMF